MTKRQKIYIGVAWPYANGEQHIGHMAGAYLPPDILARFHRLLGSDVLMVSGSDSHGTPITVKADEENTTPQAILNRYHPLFIEAYCKFGVTFDLFTHTETQTHWDVAHDIFLQHQKNGYLYKDSQKQLFDEQTQKFLPDRYVEGTCPHCGAKDARGDQCDNCGKTYEAVELKNPRSKVTGSTQLAVRETEHFFLDLGKLNEPLLQWIDDGHKKHWRAHVLNYAVSQVRQKELRGRPITRDMSWGITVPVKGFEDKRLYVWYDAVMGYLSATKEWAQLSGHTDAWQDWWVSSRAKDVRGYYFIGKDNVMFHTIMWPAMLLGYGGLQLPYDVPANEYLNMYGSKFSKSRGNVISINSVLEKFQADAWRYALTAMAPEAADTDFSWQDFVERVNNELVANWGNLANRVLGFAYKRFNGVVPQPETLDERAQALLSETKASFEQIGDLYAAVKLKSALESARAASQRVNQYLSETTPWTLIKTDEPAARTAVWVALQCIEWLKVMWAPILPHSSQQLHEMLGFDGQLFGRQYTETVKDARGEHLVLRYDHSAAIGSWRLVELTPGQPLREPKALFVKLDEAEVIPKD